MNRFILKKFYTHSRQYNTNAMSRKAENPDAGKYVLFSIPVISFCLGTWQIKRRTWKLNLIEEMKSKTYAKPIELPEDLTSLKDLEYRKVYLKGKFIHAKEVYIGPRACITEGGNYAGSKFEPTAQSGHFVVTPFYLPDRDLTILVNRGWVPKSKLKPETRLEGQIDGEISLVGFVRSNEKSSIFSPKHDPSLNYFYYRDIEEIARKCDTAPIFIDADVTSTVSGGPIGGQTRLTVRNEHTNYIITWYSLSLFTAIMWYYRYKGTFKKIII